MRMECEQVGRKGSVAIDVIVDVIAGCGIHHHCYTTVILHVFGGGLYNNDDCLLNWIQRETSRVPYLLFNTASPNCIHQLVKFPTSHSLPSSLIVPAPSSPPF